MKKFDEMLAHYNKLGEIRQGVTKAVLATGRGLKDEFYMIDRDPLLSPHGKHMKKEEVKKQYEKALMKELRRIRDEYDQTVIKARVAAENILNEKPTKPSPTAVSTFERKFNDFKMRLMLQTNAETALRELKDFVNAQNDPYFAYQILSEFPALVQSILGAAGSDSATYKTKLRDVYDTIVSKSMTEEQKKAKSIYDSLEHELDRPLMIEGGAEMNAIRDTFGPQVAKYANNPHQYVLENEQGKEKSE